MIIVIPYNYCKLFEVEKFCSFRGLIGDHETFPAKYFRSSFKLECYGRTLQDCQCDIQLVISNSSAISKISRVHAVGLESNKLSGTHNYSELLSRCVRLMKSRTHVSTF